ncbi:EAL domain-containing protein [Vibrio sp. WXL103]|uniref:EAL domain-containing protein n=1 Tax=Vibrio sp. WXL103 TaxID=3450710 RepID=UPI003EC4CDFE
MDSQIASLVGKSFKWVLDLSTWSLFIANGASRAGFEFRLSLLDVFRHISPVSRKRLRNLLLHPNNYGVARASFIYQIDDVRSCIVYIEHQGNHQGQVNGLGNVQSVIPSQVGSEWLLQTLLNDQRKSVIIADESFNILCVNHRLLNKFDVKEEQILGLPVWILSAGASSAQNIQSVLLDNRDKESWGSVAEFAKSNGESSVQDIDVRAIRWSADNQVYVINLHELNGLQLNLTDSEQVKWQPSFDLPSRQAIIERVEQGCKDQVLMVACIRPNFFKSVREEADRRLSLALKKLSIPLVMGRLESGVYCLVTKLCPKNFQDTHAVTKLLRQLRKELKSNVHDLIYRDIVNGHWGIDIYGIDNSSLDKVIERALQTMRVHDRRKTPYAFFNRQLVEKANTDQKLTAAVLEAVRLRNIDVAFQPIVNISTGRIHRLEALCRFTGGGKEYSVQKLIDTAEKIGVVHVLDKIVAERALHGMEKIRAKFPTVHRLSLNCSLKESDEKLKCFDELCTVIQKHKPENISVMIEITESAYFDNSLMDSEQVMNARDNGIDIAVDDFGSGNSSFQYFNDIKFDCIKIDRSFISDIDSVRHKYLAVKMLTELAHELAVDVVVEGVETLAELKTLAALKVKYVQGYYFSKPCSLQQILECESINDVIDHPEYAVDLIAISEIE